MKKLLTILIIFTACNQKVLQPPTEAPVVDSLTSRMGGGFSSSISPAQVDTKIRNAMSPMNTQISLLKSDLAAARNDGLMKDKKIADLTATQTVLLSANINQQRKALSDSINNARSITALVLSNQSLQIQAATIKTYTDTLNVKQKGLQLNLDNAVKYLDGEQFIITGNTIKLNIPAIANQLKQ